MTANQYRYSIDALGLTQAGAATFLGLSLRTSQGYALGENPVPEAVAKLLRIMLKFNIPPKDVK
jgi:hypothetical protein